MKKGIVFNFDILLVIFCLGYIDMLVVCDVGLFIFKSIMCIDMVLIQGVFFFMQVLGVVINEMQVVLILKSWIVKYEVYRFDFDI